MSRLALGSTIVFACFVVFACSSEDEADGSSSPSSTGSGGDTTGNGGSGATGTGTGGGGGSGGAPSGPGKCAQSCAAPADCVGANAQPPFDEDNWTCEGGLCTWKGCLDDEECAFFGGVCRPGGPVTGSVNACTEACTNVDVCAEALASVDIDNWACRGGGCEYTGCLSDDECVTDFGPGSKCLPGTDGPAACATGCTTPADCVADGAPPTHDEDNWQCTDGVCVYSGCNSDEECTQASGGPAVCISEQ